MRNKFGSAADDPLTHYMRDVRKYAVLDRDAEAALARRWRDNGDPAAGEQLVGSHQRLVVKIATEYRGYGLPLTDLIAEGNVGLMHAIDKFDVERGYRLSTYAMWWIRAAITDYILRSSSLVRMVHNEHQKKLFFKLRRLRQRFQPDSDGALTGEAATAIAEALDVPMAEVMTMDRRLAAREVSVNSRISSRSELELQDVIADEAIDQETKVIDADEATHRRARLNAALARLDARERRILVERKLTENPPKLSDLSKELGVSRERVRQIEARALEKLKVLMAADSAADQPPLRPRKAA